jgi:hypothetical protein
MGTTDPQLYVFISKGNKKNKNKNTYSPHAAYFHLFCSKDKATKAGCPTTRCGYDKGQPHNKATTTNAKAPTDDDASRKLETLSGLIVFGQ